MLKSLLWKSGIKQPAFWCFCLILWLCTIAAGADILSKNPKDPEKIASLKRYLRATPNDYESYVALGTEFGKMAKYHDAVEAFKRAIRNYPDGAMAHYFLGVALLKISNKGLTLHEVNEQVRILKSLDKSLAEKLFRQTPDGMAKAKTQPVKSVKEITDSSSSESPADEINRVADLPSVSPAAASYLAAWENAVATVITPFASITPAVSPKASLPGSFAAPDEDNDDSHEYDIREPETSDLNREVDKMKKYLRSGS